MSVLAPTILHMKLPLLSILAQTALHMKLPQEVCINSFGPYLGGFLEEYLVLYILYIYSPDCLLLREFLQRGQPGLRKGLLLLLQGSQAIETKRLASSWAGSGSA